MRELTNKPWRQYIHCVVQRVPCCLSCVRLGWGQKQNKGDDAVLTKCSRMLCFKCVCVSVALLWYPLYNLQSSQSTTMFGLCTSTQHFHTSDHHRLFSCGLQSLAGPGRTNACYAKGHILVNHDIDYSAKWKTIMWSILKVTVRVINQNNSS